MIMTHSWTPSFFKVQSLSESLSYAKSDLLCLCDTFTKLYICRSVHGEVVQLLHSYMSSQVAKWVGDIFNRGIYDTHIELKKTPFLEWESPRQLDKLIAEDVMNSSSSALSYLYPITRVRSIQRLLRTTAHSAFLVVTPCKASSIPVLPKSVMKTIPQLYTRPSMKCNSKQELKSCRTGIRNPDTEELKHVKGMLAYKVMPTLEDDICESYSLPVHKMELERKWQHG